MTEIFPPWNEVDEIYGRAAFSIMSLRRRDTKIIHLKSLGLGELKRSLDDKLSFENVKIFTFLTFSLLKNSFFSLQIDYGNYRYLENMVYV